MSATGPWSGVRRGGRYHDRVTEIGKVGVVGLGTMGAGIAEVFARGGLPVVGVEVDEQALARGRAALTGSVDRAVSRGRMTDEERAALLDRVTFTTDLSALADVDLVVEAVSERMDLKHRVFATLDRVCRADAVLATNTSSLSVTEIAAATSRPERVIGVHFFNPAPVMKLVEVIGTVLTRDGLTGEVAALCTRLGKTPVTVGDRAGFIANALLFGYLNDAVAMLERGYARREDIDAAMAAGYGLPMGPLTLLDLIGLDTSYEILKVLYDRGGRQRRHAASPLLAELVTAGLLGRKTGRGFYTYEAPGSGKVVDADPGPAAPDGLPVSSVGLVGSDPDTARLVEDLASAGCDVATATWRPGAPSSLDAVRRADLVLVSTRPDGEPGTTDRDAMTMVFAALGEVTGEGTLLASTSATVPLVELAVASGRPADVVGIHPLPGKAAEVAHGVLTAPAARDRARDVVAATGRTPVVCRDRAGLVAGALLAPHLNDAVRMHEGGYASVDDIDTAMRLGCGYPTGPFAVLDELGLDVVLETLEAVHAETREPSVAPSPLLVQLVTAGRLGRRTGEGFRRHTQD